MIPSSKPTPMTLFSTRISMVTISGGSSMTESGAVQPTSSVTTGPEVIVPWEVATFLDQ